MEYLSIHEWLECIVNWYKYINLPYIRCILWNHTNTLGSEANFHVSVASSSFPNETGESVRIPLSPKQVQVNNGNQTLEPDIPLNPDW